MEEVEEIRQEIRRLNSEIQNVQNRIGDVEGSLKNMKTIESIVKDVSQTANLREKHHRHMSATHQVFILHMNRLAAEQVELISLLQEQQRVIQSLLSKMRDA